MLLIIIVYLNIPFFYTKRIHAKKSCLILQQTANLHPCFIASPSTVCTLSYSSISKPSGLVRFHFDSDFTTSPSFVSYRVGREVGVM